jgi:hypothetical protein
VVGETLAEHNRELLERMRKHCREIDEYAIMRKGYIPPLLERGVRAYERRRREAQAGQEAVVPDEAAIGVPNRRPVEASRDLDHGKAVRGNDPVVRNRVAAPNMQVR